VLIDPEEAMENSFLDRLRDNLTERRQSLAAWFKEAPATTKTIVTGPAGEKALLNRIHDLDTAIEQAGEKTLGLCDVCHDYVDASRLEMDFAARICIDHLTGEEKTRLENDLELSQKVQKALLPEIIPTINGLDIAAFSQPASIVGGDYFDFLRFKDGSHGFVIADVMGKGMAASMLMASFQASLSATT
jgi:RNA polymerase-binding transcription factor DksA